MVDYFRKIVVICLALISWNSFSQDTNRPYVGKIKRKQFKEYIENAPRYFPKDICSYPILYLGYSLEDFFELDRKAYCISYKANKVDIECEPLPSLNDLGLPEYYVNKVTKKFDSVRFLKITEYKNLFLDNIIVSQCNIDNFSIKDYPYIIKKIIISDKKNKDHIAYLSAVFSYVYDRRTDKQYEVFSAFNYSLGDLIKAAGCE